MLFFKKIKTGIKTKIVVSISKKTIETLYTYIQLKKTAIQYRAIKYWSDLLFSTCLKCVLLKCDNAIDFNNSGLFLLILDKEKIKANSGISNHICSCIVLSNKIKLFLFTVFKPFAF